MINFLLIVLNLYCCIGVFLWVLDTTSYTRPRGLTATFIFTMLPVEMIAWPLLLYWARHGLPEWIRKK